METSGYLVSPATELSARMKDGKYHFYSGNAGFMVDTDRNTTSVIYNRNGIILINCNIDGITIAGKSFIHRIVYDFVDQMVESPAGCSTNIHTRSFADRFQTFQYLYLVRAIFAVAFCVFSTHIFLHFTAKGQN